ncbi:MAG: site-specific DNA-methyltransferase [Bacteroidales bacterium]|nr:site-specific DNA-methyltransferase [Bacteroidales bacterium]
MKENKQKRPRKPKSLENQPGKYDERNVLNDLDGRSWLLLTKSFWISESCPEDKAAYKHPAPFLIKDIEKLISLFTKQGMIVLDPFAGSGTTLIAADNLKRKGVGIDLSEEYHQLYLERIANRKSIPDCVYYVGDSLALLDNVGFVDYIVTSPPYHNILRNKSKGTRNNNGKNFRMSARDGIIYYSDNNNDLGNFENYEDFLSALKAIMKKGYDCLRDKKYASIIISDFTVEKKEICVQADIVKMMQDIGFQYVGTTVLLQTVKPLYPFGYPYAYKINHHHQNIISFRKDIILK